MKTSIKTLLIAAGVTAGIAAASVYANWPGPGACPQGQAMGYGGPGMGSGMGPGMGFGPQGMGPGHGMGFGMHGMGRGPQGMGFGGPGIDSELRIEHMTEALGLTPEQRDKVRAVADKNRPQMRALHDRMTDSRKQLWTLRQQGGASDADVRALADGHGKLVAEMIVHRNKMRGEIEAVLTPEQREALKQRFGHRGPYRGADAAAGAASGT